MPLSEHEQRQLEQIEQALYADYPRFANTVRAADPQVHFRRRMVYAVTGCVAGLGMLFAGVVLSRYIWLSVVGFVVMLACVMWGISSHRKKISIAQGRLALGADRRTARSARAEREWRAGRRFGRRRSRRQGLTERLEERWRRRHEGDGR